METQAKYIEWYFGQNRKVSWCAIFLSWCAEQCGFINDGIIPKFCSCDIGMQWFQKNNQFVYSPAYGGPSYTPKSGDIIFFTWHNNKLDSEHVGIVVSSSGGKVYTVEGNTSNKVANRSYSISSNKIIGYGLPKYPNQNSEGAKELESGKVINLPQGLGKVNTYMGWQCITSKTSDQYKLRESSGMNFDGEGYGKVGDRYAIACTSTYGKVGDYVDFKLENGQVIKGIIADTKNQNDPGCNKWGHMNGNCVVEFVVDKDSWYKDGKGNHSNPGTANNHPEWKSYVTQVENKGSYFA